MPQLSSWMITYDDGTVLSQKDEQSPYYVGDPGSGEVPFKAIEWARAQILALESQWAKSTFQVLPAAPGLATSLRCRTFRVMNAAQQTWLGPSVSVMMIITSLAEQEVTDDSVRHVTYWFPDGTVHDCHRFNCPDVANFITQGTPLMPHTAATNSQADALLA